MDSTALLFLFTLLLGLNLALFLMGSVRDELLLGIKTVPLLLACLQGWNFLIVLLCEDVS